MSNEKLVVDAFKEEAAVSPLDKGDFNIRKIFEFENNKDYVVRPHHQEFFQAGTLTTPEDMAKKLRALFAELREKYDINAPVQYVVAKDEKGTDGLFNLTRRVERQDLDQLTDEERDAARQGLQHVFTQVLRYYDDKERSGETFMSDLPGAEQYVYGKIDGGQNSWHLVDTDPLLADSKVDLFGTLDFLLEQLEFVEDDFHMDLTKQRRGAEALISKVAAGLETWAKTHIQSDDPTEEFHAHRIEEVLAGKF